MDRKGVSPLIATVLIIGFTVALAAIIITWGGRFVQQTQEDVDRQAKVGIACSKLNFEVTKTTCATHLSYPGALPNYGALDKITMSSNTNQDIAGFTFRLTNHSGSGAIAVVTFNGVADSLNAFSAKTYTVSTPLGLVGNTSKVEAIAYVTVEGITEACQAGIEEITLSNTCNYVA